MKITDAMVEAALRCWMPTWGRYPDPKSAIGMQHFEYGRRALEAAMRVAAEETREGSV